MAYLCILDATTRYQEKSMQNINFIHEINDLKQETKEYLVYAHIRSLATHSR